MFHMTWQLPDLYKHTQVVHTHTWARTYTYIHMFTCIHTHKKHTYNTSKNTHKQIHTCVYTHIQTCTHSTWANRSVSSLHLNTNVLIFPIKDRSIERQNISLCRETVLLCTCVHTRKHKPVLMRTDFSWASLGLSSLSWSSRPQSNLWRKLSTFSMLWGFIPYLY